MTTSFEQDILARTVWGEARGEGKLGMKAVACVIMNRVKNHKVKWWGKTITQVCTRKWQFSCWNENDPNRSKCKEVTTKDKQFQIACEIAQDAIDGVLNDISYGADHYLMKDLEPKPVWASDESKITTKIGKHIFYNLEGKA